MATIKDLRRMCKNMKCKDCPLSNNGDVTGCWGMQPPGGYPDDIDEIVDKWIEEHPVKTFLQDFFKKYPYGKTGEKGIPITRGTIVCRKELYSDELPCIWSCGGCTKCWHQEMKEEK